MSDTRVLNVAAACPPTTFVIDRDDALRARVKELLASVGLRVETYDSAARFLAAYDPARAGCLVLEVRLPGLGGLDLLEQLACGHVAPPAVVLTAHGDIPMAVRALRTGAVDFLEKPFHSQQLLDRVHEALQRDAASRRAHALCAALQARAGRLTPREREVMQLVVAGAPNKLTAARLGITRKAVEAHRGRVMAKMQARNLAELVRMSIALACPPGPFGRPFDALNRLLGELLVAHDPVDRTARAARSGAAARQHVELAGGIAPEG